MNGLIFKGMLSPDDRGSLNFPVAPLKLPYFFQKFQFMIIGQAKFLIHINKTILFLGKVYLVIIGTIQIFKWHYQQCLFLQNLLSARDNRVSSNFQMTRVFLQKFQFMITKVA